MNKGAVSFTDDDGTMGSDISLLLLGVKDLLTATSAVIDSLLLGFRRGVLRVVLVSFSRSCH